MKLNKSFKRSVVLGLLLGSAAIGCGSSTDSGGGNTGSKGGSTAGGKGGSNSSSKGGSGGGGSGSNNGGSNASAGGSPVLNSTGGTGGTGGGGTNAGGMAGSSNAAGSTGGLLPIPKSLIGYWPLDTDAKDMSGNNNDGSVVQGPTDKAATKAPKFVTGKKGMALELDNPIQGMTPTWIKVPRSDSLDKTGITGSFSASAWVNPKAFDNDDDFNFAISRHEDGTPFEIFALGTLSGRPSLGVHFFFATAGEALQIDRWTHIAGTYDGITLSVYVNGVLAETKSIGWGIIGDNTHAIIGANQNIDVVKESWNGLIDEVRLYSDVISAEEVKADMMR
jgi:hypothetical protein